MSKPSLYILSGLPASGKSTLGKLLAQHLNAAYLRIDTIEQSLKNICKMKDIYDEGYRVAHELAKENLKTGVNVVADSVNPLALTRTDWNQVAIDLDLPFINIEVTCSDIEEHKKRIQNRVVDVKDLKLPNWNDVNNREYHQWESFRLVIDTAGKTIEDSFHELKNKI